MTQAAVTSPSVPWTGNKTDQPYSRQKSDSRIGGSGSDHVSSASSAYMNSYSVSLAYAQLSQQQQMQQMQQQMLLQQQQLILQQQELMRQQHIQHQHDSDQTQMASLVNQLLQQQKQLAELELHMKGDKEVHQDDANDGKQSEDTAAEREIIVGEAKNKGMRPQEEQTCAVRKDPHEQEPVQGDQHKPTAKTPKSSVPQPESHVHPKVDLEHLFDDFSRQQLSEISQSKKQSGKQLQDDAPTKLKERAHSSDKASEEMSSDAGTTAESSEIQEGKKEKERYDEQNPKMEGSEEHQDEKEENSGKVTVSEGLDQTGAAENQKQSVQEEEQATQDDKKCKDNEERELQRRHEIEAQIEKIKEFQKQHQQPQAQYLYEPGCIPTPQTEPNKSKDVSTDAQTREETGKLPFHRQWGHYYDSEQSCIEQEANNQCLNKEELVNKLSTAVESFEALIQGLKEKCPETGLDGFTSEWKVRQGKRMKTNNRELSQWAD